MNAMPHIGVVGGSIGGLTAALVLRDLGCEIDVFERSGTALEARGAGIGLHPMTTRYFDESSELDTTMIEIELPSLQFLSASGERIYRERMSYRFSSWNTIYRGLVRCFDERRYHLGCEVTDFSQDDRGVTVSLTSGTTHTLDMLVCADGISSGARVKLLPSAQARYAGYVAWRATVPESELAPRKLRGAARLHHLLPAALRARPRLSHPEPRRRPRAGPAAREPRLVSQLRGRSWVPGDPSLRLGVYGPGR